MLDRDGWGKLWEGMLVFCFALLTNFIFKKFYCGIYFIGIYLFIYLFILLFIYCGIYIWIFNFENQE